MAKRIKDPVIFELLSLVTVAEAADRWHVSVSAVYMAIDRGKLDARKSGGIWLITAESLTRYWGTPEPPDLGLCTFTLPRWRRAS